MTAVPGPRSPPAAAFLVVVPRRPHWRAASVRRGPDAPFRRLPGVESSVLAWQNETVSDFANRSHHKDLSAPGPDSHPCPIHRQLAAPPRAKAPATKIRSRRPERKSRQFPTNSRRFLPKFRSFPHIQSQCLPTMIRKNKSKPHRNGAAAERQPVTARGSFDAACPPVVAIPCKPRGQRHADAGACRAAVVRLRRRRHRLQPRRVGPHRHAGGARRLGADGLQGRPDAHRRRLWSPRPRRASRRSSTAPRSMASASPRSSASPPRAAFR